MTWTYEQHLMLQKAKHWINISPKEVNEKKKRETKAENEKNRESILHFQPQRA